MNSYDLLTLRNIDYIPAELQEKIRNTVLLIAGCGIGSSLAETAVRLGFENFILADADEVSAHNLNRQCYVAADIGKPKVEGLANRLRAINPSVSVELFNQYLNAETVPDIVARADIVFDTIDFLDLSGIVALHDECQKQKKPVVTALAIGWGAGCVYFPPNADVSFRQLFGLDEEGSVENELYSEKFAVVVERLQQVLDPVVFNAVAKALTVMEDGKPCPASQVSPGAFSVGALAGTLIVRILAGQEVKPAPDMLVVDMPTALTSFGIPLA